MKMKKIATLLLMAVIGFGAMADNFRLLEDKDGDSPSFVERSTLSFYWGFNSWGSTPFSGLMGEDLAGNSVRTSFSSYQLNFSYNIIDVKQFNAGIGLGYESDIYKFKNPYVNFLDNTFQVATPATEGDWSSRFVTRYVQVPIHLGWASKNGNYEVVLSAIPAIGYTNKHTGLKHELKLKGPNELEQTNLKNQLLPYKLDVRLEFRVYGFGIFMQVSTFKVMKDGYTDLFPIKFGFRI